MSIEHCPRHGTDIEAQRAQALSPDDASARELYEAAQAPKVD